MNCSLIENPHGRLECNPSDLEGAAAAAEDVAPNPAPNENRPCGWLPSFGASSSSGTPLTCDAQTYGTVAEVDRESAGVAHLSVSYEA